MTRAYFGTDGVRGLYGGPLINEAFAARLGAAAGRWLQGRGNSTGRIPVGRDTRASGVTLAGALAAGLRTAGFEPVDLGVVPTPAVARAVQSGRLPLGAMVTASHNPAGDNGIKFFGAGGIKLTDADEWAIEQALPPAFDPRPVAMPAQDALTPYLAAAAALLPERALAGWKIALDTANGSTWMSSPVLLRRLGAEVIALGAAPDGTNINAGVGSEHPAGLAAAVVATGTRLGIAHDGDGDRCVLVDETGQVLDGDEVLTILATHALAQERLVNRTLVVTVQSNLGVDAAVRAAGGRVLRTAVGDRYVSERMRAEGARLGGESSGHIIFADVSNSGDGLVAALQVIAVMRESGLPLSVLRQRLRKFPQLTAALRVREKRDLSACTTLARVRAALEAELAGRGRVLVRYSGTEAMLRLLVEGPEATETAAGLARLEAAARADLAVL
ncbi:MAG: phosphoglucosamine mutase [Opitutales bacterium]